MTYQETLDYLFTRLPMFQRSGPAAYKNNLDNTLKLDGYYGHPHRKFKTIHVAGTNGKGSVSHMLASVLQAAGYKTGLYTSPHLKDFRERIRVNGEVMNEAEVVNWVGNYRTKNESWKLEPSFFELGVAMAFDHFAQKEVDVAVVEVGLGGRLDSTNIITPEVSVITNIGFDHVNLLGDTLELIAAEKAGIIKPGVPAVIGTTQDKTSEIFKKTAAKKKAPLYFADSEYKVSLATKTVDGLQNLQIEREGKTVYRDLELDLLGSYQQKNIAAVLKTIDVIRQIGFAVSDADLRSGLKNVIKNTSLMGRWQVLGANPVVVCDTGHNEDGIKTIVEQIQFIPHENLHMVFGTVGDKNPDRVLALLPKNARYYFVKANIERALNEKELLRQAAGFGLSGETYSSVKEGLRSALENAGKNDLVFVGGSTFVVAEIL